MGEREFYSDNKGRWIGSVMQDTDGKKIILDEKGALLGRVVDNKTYDKKGAYYGNGDQSTRLFGSK